MGNSNIFLSLCICFSIHIPWYITLSISKICFLHYFLQTVWYFGPRFTHRKKIIFCQINFSKNLAQSNHRIADNSPPQFNFDTFFYQFFAYKNLYNILNIIPNRLTCQIPCGFNFYSFKKTIWCKIVDVHFRILVVLWRPKGNYTERSNKEVDPGL